MIAWTQKDAALVAQVAFTGGRDGSVVLLADAQNPKGAICLLSNAQGGPPQPAPLAQVLEQIPPSTIVSILCMQERHFGRRGLPKPPALA